MLEEVREAGAAFGLGADADVVEHGDADDRRGPVRREHDPQAVGERVVGDVEAMARAGWRSRHVRHPMR